jgi:RNA polymerase sigma factor (sigma-70 family)
MTNQPAVSDSERLEAVFRHHYRAVLAYARRRAPADLADDVAAETFAVAWRRANEVPTSPLPWLLGVARKVLSTQRRSVHRRMELQQRLSGAASTPVSELPQPIEERVTVALRALAENDREAIMLIAWDELAVKEAAAVVGLSAAAFSVRLHRAKRRLRKQLERDDDGSRVDSVAPAWINERSASKGET